MAAFDQSTIRFTFNTALGVFFVLNVFSWDLGWGGRRDMQLGREVERHFGWPAHFYVDYWRSDVDEELTLGAYLPPLPFTSESRFQYCGISVIALLLDVAIIVCAAIAVLIWTQGTETKLPRWHYLLAGSLAGLACLIWLYGSEFNAYL